MASGHELTFNAIVMNIVNKASPLMAIDPGSLQSLDWNGGLERWTGTVDWNGGLESFDSTLYRFLNILHCACA